VPNSRQAGVSLPCPDCRGQRLHAVVLVRAVGGLVTRQAQCPTCALIRPIPPEKRMGICCPQCLHVFLRCLPNTKHHPGRIVRVRACRMCGHRVRTTERISGGAPARVKKAPVV
jgi:hypothetical protein